MRKREKRKRKTFRKFSGTPLSFYRKFNSPKMTRKENVF